MKTKIHYIVLFTILCSLFTLLTSCEKVSPIGVLVSGTGVEDRVKMSNLYFQEYKDDWFITMAKDDGSYSFLVGADSHMTTDPGRMEEMFQNALDHDDALIAHLGDIADTKAEYYILLDKTIQAAKLRYAEKKYKKIVWGDEDSDDDLVLYRDTVTDDLYDIDDIKFPFCPVVGNHDITHNGWALWSNIFHSSFYDTGVMVLGTDGTIYIDHFIFLDTASGTLGKEQVDLIEQGVLDGKALEDEGFKIRNTFVFSHTNIFRPSSLQFASTFPREESFFLLNQFVEWDADIVFCGHVHKWDYQEVGGVHYITLDSMSEANNPEPGDYLVRVHVAPDGTYSWERVHMNK